MIGLRWLFAVAALFVCLVVPATASAEFRPIRRAVVVTAKVGAGVARKLWRPLIRRHTSDKESREV